MERQMRLDEDVIRYLSVRVEELEGEDKKSGNQNISGSTDNQTMFFSGQFNYNNTFNKVLQRFLTQKQAQLICL